MDHRPSAPLIRMLREAAKNRGLNTAALAKRAGVDRGVLKQVLAGQVPLTVDLFISLAESLELGATDFSALATRTDAAPDAPTFIPVAHQEATPLPLVDPLGNHADQILRLGFSLGCDMVFMLRTADLEASGIPGSVIEKFPEHLPIRLDAAFHQHNDPRFLPETIVLKLSFDTIYECTLPWSAFLQITVVPLTSRPTQSEAPGDTGPHLRLVE